MIRVLTHRSNTAPLRRLLATAPEFARRLRPLDYHRLFARRWLAADAVVFTDFDLLNGFEVDAAAGFAEAACRADPPLAVLNHPARVAERFQLLRRLRRAGLNPVEVVRLDSGERPSRYPVFLRCEDGYFGPETDLLADAAAFDAAVAALTRAGRSLKRRIAVSFEAERDRDGYFRKYGAFVVGDRIVPQHILRGPGWTVKSGAAPADAAFNREERAYVFDNPHEALLRPIFAAAGIDFGRIDYTLRDGRPVVFEINTNPTFPRFTGGDPARQERRDVIRRRLGEAFAAIDRPGPRHRRVHLPVDSGIATPFLNRAAWYEDPRVLLEPSRWAHRARRVVAAVGRRGDREPRGRRSGERGVR